VPDTPMVRKLGIKAGYRVLLLDAPDGWRGQLGAMPEGVTLAETPDGAFDCVLLFAPGKADLARRAPAAISAVRPAGLLWIAYPKKTSKRGADLSRDEGWDVVHAAGWQGVSLIALDEIWSAMRFRPLAETVSATKTTSGAKS
jgi:hypothetical protein